MACSNVVWPDLSFLDHKVLCFCRFKLGYVEPFKTLAALSVDYVTKHPPMHPPFEYHLSRLPTVKMNEISLLKLKLVANFSFGRDTNFTFLKSPLLSSVSKSLFLGTQVDYVYIAPLSRFWADVIFLSCPNSK
jgi:hypothetical protein